MTSKHAFLVAVAALSACGESSWSKTGTMIEARAHHSATVLDNGQILLAGGIGSNGALSSIELYDPLEGGWIKPPASAQMGNARHKHTATFFLDMEGKGHVLVVGGEDGSALNSAESYDTAAGTWSSGPTMAEARSGHTAALLGDHRRVLIAGGDNGQQALSSMEIFDATQAPWSFQAMPPLTMARARHTATLLREGLVLIAGGDNRKEALNSAELFDPAKGQWIEGAPSMGGPRAGHSATLLHDGRVLVAGGQSGVNGGAALNTVEIYDPNPEDKPVVLPEDGRWCTIAAPMAEARSGHTATLLDNGMVLMVGGEGANGALNSVELYDPKRPSALKHDCDCDCGAWEDAGSLGDARVGHTAARLPDGSVLIAGGMGARVLASAELYKPETQCRTLSDCPESLICNEDKQCVAPEVTCSGDDCGPQPSIEGACMAAGGGPKGAGGLAAAAAALFAVMARRRNRGAFNGRRLQ